MGRIRTRRVRRIAKRLLEILEHPPEEFRPLLPDDYRMKFLELRFGDSEEMWSEFKDLVRKLRPDITSKRFRNQVAGCLIRLVKLRRRGLL
ncbi:hypothetical protein DRN94_001555 [archaeon]|nr:hypothetical protein [archaeon]